MKVSSFLGSFARLRSRFVKCRPLKRTDDPWYHKVQLLGYRDFIQKCANRCRKNICHSAAIRRMSMTSEIRLELEWSRPFPEKCCRFFGRWRGWNLNMSFSCGDLKGWNKFHSKKTYKQCYCMLFQPILSSCAMMQPPLDHWDVTHEILPAITKMVGIENGGFNFEPMGDSMGNPKFYDLKSLIFPIEIARTGCPIGSTALLNCNFCCWWPQMLVPNFLTRHKMVCLVKILMKYSFRSQYFPATVS